MLAKYQTVVRSFHLAAILAATALVCVFFVASVPANAAPEWEPTGGIGGTILDSETSEPIERVIVRVEPVGKPAASNFSQWPTQAATDILGRYYIYNVPPGEYRVFFDAMSNQTGQASAWYPNSQFREGASSVTVESDETTIVNASLDPGGSMTGIVEIKFGQSATVHLYAWNATTSAWTEVASGPTQQGSSFFAFNGLTPGAHKVWAQRAVAVSPDVSVYSSAFYDEAQTFDTAADVEIVAQAEAPMIRVTLPESPPTIPAERIEGANRFETAAQVSARFSSADIAFVANGLNFPDALSAAPVAAKLGGPVLLTRPDALPPAAAGELARLSPSTVVIVGSTGSVSDAVSSEIQSLLPEAAIERVAGENRYATSRALARYGFSDSYVREVYIATGASFPDALSAGSIAGHNEFPVILVDGKSASVDQATVDLLHELRPQEAFLLGQAGTISESYRSSFYMMEQPRPQITRYGGTDRYMTSFQLNQLAYGASPTENVYLALGTNFPDALAGAALAGAEGAPLFIVKGNCVPLQVKNLIQGLSAQKLVLLGGPAGLTTAVENLVSC